MYYAELKYKVSGRRFGRQHINIYNGYTFITSYIRDYNNFIPFYSFEVNGQWYALYSEQYYTLKLVKLPSMELVYESEGFFSFDIVVPRYEKQKLDSEFEYIAWECGKDYKTFEANIQNKDNVKYANFAFITGCVWGDDSDTKIRMLDLSDITNGFKVHESLGYVVVPEEYNNILELIEIDTDLFDDGYELISFKINSIKYFGLSGNKVDVLDR